MKVCGARMQRLSALISSALMCSYIACEEKSAGMEQAEERVGQSAGSNEAQNTKREVRAGGIYGDWRFIGVVDLLGDQSELQRDADIFCRLYLAEDSISFFWKDDDELVFQCAYDSLRLDTLKNYGEKDLNPQFRGTSYWYGYRPERTALPIIARAYCNEDWVSFEYIAPDTIGYFYWRKLYLLVKEH